MANKYWTGASDNSYATAGNFQASGVPGAGDHVRFTPGSSVAVSGGLNQSAVAIGDFIVERGNSSTLGTRTSGVPTYLQIDPDRFEFAGSGISYIDLGSAAIDAQVLATASGGTGLRGLYLLGSALDDLIVMGGEVGLAEIHGSTSTVAMAHVLGGSLWLGAGTTLTTLRCVAGEAALRCAATTVNQYGGVVVTEEIGAITTFNVFGGVAVLNSIGTLTTLNIYPGARVILTASNRPRTITTTNLYPGATALSLEYDPAVITFTNKPVAAYPARLAATAV